MKDNREKLDIKVKLNKSLSQKEYAEITGLTTQAFKRDYSPFLKAFPDPVHVLGRYHGKLVSQVLWITRWLQLENGPLLRTAYIEGLATDMDYRNQGYASEVMRRAIQEVQDFDIAALSTGSHSFYTRLGWQLWQGPLFVRTDKGLVPTPEEHGVMVLPLPLTPPIDVSAPLSVEWREIEPW
jgi:aminoglycoside 2'-N-acetyltransferase I